MERRQLWAGAAVGAPLIGAGLLARRQGLTALFLVLYLGIMIGSVWLQSTVFLAFGAGGTCGLICYLVLRNLDGAGAIAFGLIFIGLFVVFTGTTYQKWIETRLLRLFGRMRQPTII